jgi:hypothetical protein
MKRFAMIGAQGALWFLATGLILSLPPPASAQVQEGVLSGTFAAFGTVKATAAGKERLVLAIDENGLSVTNGVLDHMTWHCSGLAEFTNGIGQTQGFCVGRSGRRPGRLQLGVREARAGAEGCARNVHLDRRYWKIRGDPRQRNVCGLFERIPTAN